jgi:hypothetical protein
MDKYYVQAKQHYENTKPIRGRSEDIRPAGKRRRDWERIVRLGEDAYAYRLYSTECVIYEPNRITLTCNSWCTPLTAKFMTSYSPFPIMKARNVLWAAFDMQGFSGWYPIHKQMFINLTEDGRLVPEIKPVPVRCVDRKKAKELRARIEPFVKYCEAMLKLSDGWVTHKFREDVRESVFNSSWVRVLRENMTINDLIDTPEELMPYYFLEMVGNMARSEERQVGIDWRERDMRYDPKYLRRVAYDFHDRQDNSFYKTVERMPDGELFYNILVD